MILKYNADEARNLKTYGELPENAKLNEGGAGVNEEDDDLGVEFRDTGDDLAEAATQFDVGTSL